MKYVYLYVQDTQHLLSQCLFLPLLLSNPSRSPVSSVEDSALGQPLTVEEKQRVGCCAASFPGLVSWNPPLTMQRGLEDSGEQGERMPRFFIAAPCRADRPHPHRLSQCLSYLGPSHTALSSFSSAIVQRCTEFSGSPSGSTRVCM